MEPSNTGQHSLKQTSGHNDFCHLEHQRFRSRPCRDTRLQCGQTLAELMVTKEVNPEKFRQDVLQLTAQSDYMRRLVKSRWGDSVPIATGPIVATSASEERSCPPGESTKLSL